MNQLSRPTDFDDTLRTFLAWQSDAVAGAPTAEEMKRQIAERVGTGRVRRARTGPRLRLAWAVAILAVLIALLLASSAFFGRPLFNVAPPSPSVSPSLAPTAIASNTPLGYLDGTITAGDDSGDLIAVDAANGSSQMLVRCQSPCTQLISPAWSPDGRFLAYAMKAPGNTGGVVDTGQGIWVRDAAAGTSRLLLACPFGSACQLDAPMAWSPDGRRIALFQGLDLATIDVAAGTVTVIRHHDAANELGVSGLDEAWAPDGQALFYLVNGTRGSIDADGANDRPLPTLDSGIVGGIAPDVTHVAYVTIDDIAGSPAAIPGGDPGTAQLHIAGVDGSNPHVVAQFPGCCLGAWVGPAAWSADGQRLAWAGYSYVEGRTDVIVAAADGSGARLLNARVGHIRPAWYPRAAAPQSATPPPSPGPSVPATRSGPVTPSGCAPLDRVAQNSGAEDLVPAAGFRQAPTGVPGNGVVAFASLGVNDVDSYVSAVPWQGGSATVLMAVRAGTGRAFPNHLVWSPDGQMLAFSVADGVQGDGEVFTDSAFTCEDLFAASADGSQLYRLTFSQTGHGATSPAWSPDGRHIAYLAYAGTPADDAGSWPPPRRELHILDLTSGRDNDVAPCGYCGDLAWSPDLGTIAAIDSLHGGLILVDVAGGVGTRALANAGITAFRWTSGTSLLAIGTTPPIAYPVDLTRSGVGGGPLIGPERVIAPTGTWVFSPGDVALDRFGQHVLGVVERYDTGLPTIVDVDVSLERPITVPVVAIQDAHSVSFDWSPDRSAALVQTTRPASVYSVTLSDPGHGFDLSTYAIRGPGRAAWQPVWP